MFGALLKLSRNLNKVNNLIIRAMENNKSEFIQTILDVFNKSKLERKGYILLPSFEGFKLFEIDEDRLNLYLQAESLHKRALSDSNKEHSASNIQAVIRCEGDEREPMYICECKVCGAPFGDKLSLYYHYNEEHN